MSDVIEELDDLEVVEEAFEPLVVGPYALFGEVASGGMAAVHLGRLLAPDGLGRTVAIKRMHQQYTNDPDFCAMFMDEARFVGRLRHRNVVRMVDVVRSAEGLFLVMEYIHGESLSRLMRLTREAGEKIPTRIAATIVHGALLGLHSAHELADEEGKLLGVVHRDVSPQNVIIGADGIPRVLDFGVAKAAGRMQTTREGQLKGKLAYMAPEQISGKVDRRTDLFAAGVVLWEAITGRRLYEGSKDFEIVQRIVAGKYPKPSDLAPDCPPALDKIVAQALAADPSKRFSTAQRMADEIRREVGLVTRAEVAAFVKTWASDVLEVRAEQVVEMERAAADIAPLPLVESEQLPAPPSSNRDVAMISRELDNVPATIPPAPLPTPAVSAPGSRPPSKSSPALHRSSRPSFHSVHDFSPPTTTTTPSLTTTAGAEIEIHRRAITPAFTKRTAFALASTAAVFMLSVGGYGLYRKGVADGRTQATLAASPPAQPMFDRAPPTPATPALVAAPVSPAPSQPAPAEPADAGLKSADAKKPDASAPVWMNASPKASAASANNCNPPWLDDDAGLKRYKPGCMGL